MDRGDFCGIGAFFQISRLHTGTLDNFHGLQNIFQTAEGYIQIFLQQLSRTGFIIHHQLILALNGILHRHKSRNRTGFGSFGCAGAYCNRNTQILYYVKKREKKDFSKKCGIILFKEVIL